MIEERQRQPFGIRLKPQRQLRQFHRQRVAIHAIQTMHRHQPPADRQCSGWCKPLGRVTGEVGLQHRVDTRQPRTRGFIAQPAGRVQRVAQKPAGLDQKMPTAHGGIDDAKTQQRARVGGVVRAGRRDQRPQRLPHQKTHQGVRRVIRSGAFAPRPGPKEKAARRDRFATVPPGYDYFQLRPPQPDHWRRRDAGFQFQQGLINMAEVLHIQRAVMHPFARAPLRRGPKQPVQQNSNRAVAPVQSVQHRRCAFTE